MPVYETTHPPLGKDLIMVGIALFGMTAFGWRFAGTLFGVLLVPLAVVLCAPPDPQTVGGSHRRRAAGAGFYALFPKPSGND